MKEHEINALRNEALHDQRKIEDGRVKIDMNKSTVFDVKVTEDVSIHEETFDSGASVHTDPGIGRAANTLRNKAITDETPRPAKVYPEVMQDCKAVSGHKELENLANELHGWGSIKHCWKGDDSEWIVGHIDEDDRTYPLFEIDAGNYDAPDDSGKLAKFYAACNPSAISSMLASISALEAENAELKQSNELLAKKVAELECLVPRWISRDDYARNGIYIKLCDPRMDDAGQQWFCVIERASIPLPPKGESQ